MPKMEFYGNIEKIKTAKKKIILILGSDIFPLILDTEK